MRKQLCRSSAPPPPADAEKRGDVDEAMHWIDRYAAGIDSECQIDRVAVEFMRKARAAGFRTYLYFVATEDADINVARVEHRVAMGGHPVPEDKIRSRYQRSLGLLFDAVTCTDRAYIFDNSGDEKVWIAEVTDGCELEIKVEFMPDWFKKSLWDRFVDGTTGDQ